MTYKVKLVAEPAGLHKVELNHLLRQHTDMGLASAKRSVDKLLVDGELVVDVNTNEPMTFVSEAKALGADAYFVE